MIGASTVDHIRIAARACPAVAVPEPGGGMECAGQPTDAGLYAGGDRDDGWHDRGGGGQ